MKFKSISNICFWQVFYYHSCVAIVRIFIETVHHLLSHAFYRNCSLFDSQLLISYTSAIRSFFTINGVSTTNGTPSKIQIRVTNYPLRDNLFLFSRVCVYRRYIRLDRKSNRTAFLRATDRATTPILARWPWRSSDITLLASGVHRGMEKSSDLDENFRVVEIANGMRSFFRNFHEQFHTRIFSRVRFDLTSLSLFTSLFLHPHLFFFTASDSHDRNRFSFFVTHSKFFLSFFLSPKADLGKKES